MFVFTNSIHGHHSPVLAFNTVTYCTFHLQGRTLKVSSEQSIDSTVPVPPPPKPKSDSPDPRTEEVLNTIFPSREWKEGNDVWVQLVSRAPWTRSDVVELGALLDSRLKARQARETGICPVRRELYSQCFDELIRLVTITSVESGLLLSRVKDEIQMTLSAYQKLHEDGVNFGMRKAVQAELLGREDMGKKISDMEAEIHKLTKEFNMVEAECDAIKQSETEKRQVQEEKFAGEIQFLRRTNQQLKVKVLFNQAFN
uniref:Axonemal dynein light intermediate polypeptide 1 n=1 Tax=Sphaeramia orbicularis TaxID=375764 RepID=A0A672ZE10_9TELE